MKDDQRCKIYTFYVNPRHFLFFFSSDTDSDSLPGINNSCALSFIRLCFSFNDDLFHNLVQLS